MVSQPMRGQVVTVPVTASAQATMQPVQIQPSVIQSAPMQSTVIQPPRAESKVMHFYDS